jgi:hypothetical protein
MMRISATLAREECMRPAPGKSTDFRVDHLGRWAVTASNWSTTKISAPFPGNLVVEVNRWLIGLGRQFGAEAGLIKGYENEFGG